MVMAVLDLSFTCACCGKRGRGPRITIQKARRNVVICPECRFDDLVFEAIMSTSDEDVLAGRWPEIVRHATKSS